MKQRQYSQLGQTYQNELSEFEELKRSDLSKNPQVAQTEAREDQDENMKMKEFNSQRSYPPQYGWLFCSSTLSNRSNQGQEIQFEKVRLFERISVSVDQLQECVVDYLNLNVLPDNMNNEYHNNQNYHSVKNGYFKSDMKKFKNLLHATVGNFLVETVKFSSYPQNKENIPVNGMNTIQTQECGDFSTRCLSSKNTLTNRPYQNPPFMEYQQDDYEMEKEIERLQEVIRHLEYERNSVQIQIQELEYEDIITLKEERKQFEEIKREIAEYISEFKVKFLRVQLGSGKAKDIVQSDMFNEFYDILTTTEKNWRRGAFSCIAKNKTTFADDMRFMGVCWRNSGKEKGMQLKKRSQSLEIENKDQLKKLKVPEREVRISDLTDEIQEKERKIDEISLQKEVEFSIFHTFLRQFTANTRKDNLNDIICIEQQQHILDKQEQIISEMLCGQRKAQTSIYEENKSEDVQYFNGSPQEKKKNVDSLNYDKNINFENDNLLYKSLKKTQYTRKSDEQMKIEKGSFNNEMEKKKEDYMDMPLQIPKLILSGSYLNGTNNMIGFNTNNCNNQNFTIGNENSDFFLQNMEPSFNQDINNISCINRLEDEPQQVINFLETLEQKPTSRFMCQSSFKKQRVFPHLNLNGLVNFHEQDAYDQDELDPMDDFQNIDLSENVTNGNKRTQQKYNQMSFNKRDRLTLHDYQVNINEGKQLKIDGYENNENEKSQIENFMNENFDDVDNSLNLDDIEQIDDIYEQKKGMMKKQKNMDLPKLDLSTINCTEQLRNMRNTNGQPFMNNQTLLAFQMGSCINLTQERSKFIHSLHGQDVKTNDHNQFDLFKGLNNDTVPTQMEIIENERSIYLSKYQDLLNEKSDYLQREILLKESINNMQQQIQLLEEENNRLRESINGQKRCSEEERRIFESENEIIQQKKEKLRYAKEQLAFRKKQEEEREKLVGQQQLMNMLQEKNIIVSKQQLSEQWNELEKKKVDVERNERQVSEQSESLRRAQKILSDTLEKQKSIKEAQENEIQREKQALILEKEDIMSQQRQLKQKENDLRDFEKSLIERTREKDQVQSSQFRELSQEKPSQMQDSKYIFQKKESQRLKEYQTLLEQKEKEINIRHYEVLAEKIKFQSREEKIKQDQQQKIFQIIFKFIITYFRKMKGLVPNLKNLASKMSKLPDLNDQKYSLERINLKQV